MKRPSSRSRRALAAGALALLLAGGAAAYRFLSTPVPAPRVESEPAADESPPRTAAAARGAASSPAPPEERGYLRRLVVVAPPEPGRRPRRTRDASVVAEETAVDPGAPPSGLAARLTPRDAGNGSAGSGAFAAAASPALASAAAPAQAGTGPAPGAPSSGAMGRARRDAGSGGRRAPPAAGSESAALSAAASEAARLVERARGGLKSAGTAKPGTLTPAEVAADLRSQLAQDQKAQDAVRQALDALPPGASEDEQTAAAAQALESSGAPSGPEDVAQARALAARPAGAQPSAQAMDAAVRQVSSNPPDAKTLEQLAQLAMKPEPKPNAPPPRGGVAAYVRYQDAFDRAERDYGLKPSQLVPFPAIETSLGANTGKHPLRDTLLAIAEDPQGRFKPAQRKQAGRDLSAMTRLIANGDLGGRPVDQLYGSNMGAIGITQFLPTSWEAYGLAMQKGDHKDPWDFRDAVLSSANYLEKHGSRSNYDKAILSYNYSQDYLNKIKQYGANVAPGISAVRRAAADGQPPAPAPKLSGGAP